MKYLITFIALIVTVVNGLAQGSNLRLYKADVGDFNQLKVNTSIPVVYQCEPDSAGIAFFATNADVASDIIFSNNGKGSLSVDLDFDYPEDLPLPVVTVYSSYLKKVINGGDSTVVVGQLPAVEKFEAVLIGNGRLEINEVSADEVGASIRSGDGEITIGGSAETAKLSTVGTGNINASGLTATNAKISIVGTGNVRCDVKDVLTIQGMGSGKVYYLEAPSQIKNRGAGIKHLSQQ